MASVTTDKEVHVGDIGTVFEVQLQDDGVNVDLSNVTLAQMIFVKPDKTKLTKTGTVDIPNSLVTYTTLSGDIDQAGRWKVQVYVEMAAGNWYSEIITFYVYENL